MTSMFNVEGGTRIELLSIADGALEASHIIGMMQNGQLLDITVKWVGINTVGELIYGLTRTLARYDGDLFTFLGNDVDDKYTQIHPVVADAGIAGSTFNINGDDGSGEVSVVVESDDAVNDMSWYLHI